VWPKIFGKSVLLLNEAISRCLQLEHQICWIILPQFSQAKEIYWVDPSVTQYYMPLVQHKVIERNRTDLSLHFLENDSWIRFKGSDYPDRLRGSGLDFLGFDETDDIKEEAFDVIAPALADSPNHETLYIGTPKGLRKLHDLALLGDHKQEVETFGKDIKPDPDYEYFHFTSYDNQTWPEKSIERKSFVKYIDDRKREAEEQGKSPWFHQEYMASFEEGAGRFFETWTARTHTIPAFEPRRELLRVGGIDWGYAAPFVFLSSVVIKVVYDPLKHEKEFPPFHRVITYRELSGTQVLPGEWAKRIYDSEPLDAFRYIRASHDMFKRGNDGSVSITDQMGEEMGKYKFLIQEASKDRVGGWSVMRQWMSVAADGLPYWLITDSCRELKRTIPLQTYDENNLDDVDDKNHGISHWIEAARYKLIHLKWIDSHAGVVSRGTISRQKYGVNLGRVDPKKFIVDPEDVER